MHKIKTMVVDDEHDSRKTICHFLTRYCPDVAITGEAASVAEAMDLIRDAAPQLLFLDINMPGENGMQLLEKLSGSPFYTVLVTAHDEYALQAFKHHAFDYILKPIDINELVDTVARVRQREQEKKGAEQLKVLLETLKAPPADSRKIALPVSDGYLYVQAEEIVCCEAKSNYTHVHFVHRKSILVSRTLASYEETLAPYGFVRVHHQYLINLQHVEKYLRGM